MPILLPFVAPAGSVSRPESKPRCRFTRNLALESCHMRGVTRVTRVTSRRVEESNVMRSKRDSSCAIKHRVKHQDNSKSTPFFFLKSMPLSILTKFVSFVSLFQEGPGEVEPWQSGVDVVAGQVRLSEGQSYRRPSRTKHGEIL